MYTEGTTAITARAHLDTEVLQNKRGGRGGECNSFTVVFMLGQRACHSKWILRWWVSKNHCLHKRHNNYCYCMEPM